MDKQTIIFRMNSTKEKDHRAKQGQLDCHSQATKPDTVFAL